MEELANWKLLYLHGNRNHKVVSGSESAADWSMVVILLMTCFLILLVTHFGKYSTMCMVLYYEVHLSRR